MSMRKGGSSSWFDVASMMNAEEIRKIRNWVPASVKTLAVRVSGFDDELVRRLVTDPKMKSVWQYLRRAQPMDSEFADSKTIQELS